MSRYYDQLPYNLALSMGVFTVKYSHSLVMYETCHQHNHRLVMFHPLLSSMAFNLLHKNDGLKNGVHIIFLLLLTNFDRFMFDFEVIFL